MKNFLLARMFELYILLIIVTITHFSSIPVPKFTIDTFWYILLISGIQVAREYVKDHRDD